MTAIRASRLPAYGLLGMPLAMAALPVYVQAPAYYTTRLGMALSVAGIVMFAARLVDTLQDPLLGWWVDRLSSRRRLHRLLWLGAALLAAAFAGLWLPPVSGGPWLAAWLAVMLIAVYTAHSLLNVAYLAWGARLSDDEAIRTRAAAWREGAGLVGVLLASALPAWLLSLPELPPRAAMGIFAGLFAPLLLGALWLLLRRGPRWPAMGPPPAAAARPVAMSPWRTLRDNHAFRALLLPYFLNGLAVAIPATLAIFFIEDRLGAPQWVAPCLTLYFLAGAAGLALWVRLSSRIGPVPAWRVAMGVAVLAFVWTIALGPGDIVPFLVVCGLSGLALGADLALPPVLLAARIPAADGPAAYFGVWTLLGKLCLALSGLALPLLAALGYQPGTLATGMPAQALAWLYAGVPCGLKLAAMLTLRSHPYLSPEPLR